MNSTTINIRTDAATKKQAEILFKDFGISLSSAINMFLKQTIRERKIPFEIGYTSDVPNDLTSKVLSESEQGKNLSPEYDSVDDLIVALHA